MNVNAIVMESPGQVALSPARLIAKGPSDLVVEMEWSAISAGTERLLWEGRMPQFPGMGYPLVPGYESVGIVTDAGELVRDRLGERVFVPGARCFEDVRALFGGASSVLVTNAKRASTVPMELGEDAVLLSLAATAYRAVTRSSADMPELVIGHGVLGRLAARIVLALGGPAPLVWEKNPTRLDGAQGYGVETPDATPADRRFKTILDASGDAGAIDGAIRRLTPRGEIVLAGFYAGAINFAFAPAFMNEARLNISAEFDTADLSGALDLIAADRLKLDGLVTSREPASAASAAYSQAFQDPACLKMVLDWRKNS